MNKLNLFLMNLNALHVNYFTAKPQNFAELEDNLIAITCSCEGAMTCESQQHISHEGIIPFE